MYAVLLAFLVAGGGAETQAQGRKHNDKYWKHQKKANKNRAKYVRDQDKRHSKYIKERRKRADKFYKESSKRRNAYYKERYRRTHKNGPPAWARAHGYNNRNHVYFRDYRTFYDPYRAGYVYVDDGRWRFSTRVPSFMLNVDLGRASIRIIKDIPLNRHPEDFYDDYDEAYWDD